MMNLWQIAVGRSVDLIAPHSFLFTAQLITFLPDKSIAGRVQRPIGLSLSSVMRHKEKPPHCCGAKRRHTSGSIDFLASIEESSYVVVDHDERGLFSHMHGGHLLLGR